MVKLALRIVALPLLILAVLVVIGTYFPETPD